MDNDNAEALHLLKSRGFISVDLLRKFDIGRARLIPKGSLVTYCL
jgi:hypothetical protein